MKKFITILGLLFILTPSIVFAEETITMTESEFQDFAIEYAVEHGYVAPEEYAALEKDLERQPLPDEPIDSSILLAIVCAILVGAFYLYRYIHTKGFNEGYKKGYKCAESLYKKID